MNPLRSGLENFRGILILLFSLLTSYFTLGQNTYGDNFSTQAYNRNDGNSNWATNWIESGDTDNGPTAEYIRIRSNQLYMYWLWNEDIRRTANLSGAATATLSFDYTTIGLSGTQQLGVYVSNNGGTSFTQISTLSGNGSFSQDISAFIATNTVIRFAKSDANWNSNDEAYVDNFFITATLPSDVDNDGISDVSDLDNDNDGIPDSEECPYVPTVTQSFTSSGGTVITNSTSNGRGVLNIDFISIDNSFNLTINGTDIAGEFQFQPGAPGNFARFDTGFTYGQNGVPQLWSMTGTSTNPMLRVIIDADGLLQLFGAQSPAGPLVPLTLDTAPVTVPWNTSGSNTISIGQFLTGPTNMNGELRFNEECDSDGDGILNRFDLDSDNDGIYDAVEAGHNQPHVNGVLSNVVGTDGIPDVVQTNPNNGSINYTVRDTDNDGNNDALELDADADGCLDVLEAGYSDSNGDGRLGPNPLSTDGDGLVTTGSDGYTLPNDASSNGIFDFQEVGSNPIITTQPVSLTICPGCSGSFTTTATNADQYQWQIFNGGSWIDLSDSGIYSGTNTSTLSIANVTPENDAGQYRVVLGNSSFICGQTVSTTGTLSVRAPTVLTNRRITYRVNRN